MKICVVGYGYVGKAMVAAFEQGENIDYDIVDPAYEEYNNPLGDVAQSCDAVVVCVPTPQGEDGKCDDSIVLDVVETIGIYKPILVKSTTDIDTLQFFKENYPNVCFSPEFLRGRSSVEDFLAETKMIIGGHPNQAEGWANVFAECIIFKKKLSLIL